MPEKFTGFDGFRGIVPYGLLGKIWPRAGCYVPGTPQGGGGNFWDLRTVFSSFFKKTSLKSYKEEE